MAYARSVDARRDARLKQMLKTPDGRREYARQRAKKTGAAQLFEREPAPGGWYHLTIDGEGNVKSAYVPAY